MMMGMSISKRELYCLPGDKAQITFLKTLFAAGFFFFYNNFIVQHSFIYQGLLTN